MNYKISVAMASYNGEKYIEEQLNSIFIQDTPVDEIVIIDDCSNDNTEQLIRKIMLKTKIPIIFEKNEENLGVVKTFRKALSKTTGDYIFLCDQDDLWKKNKVSNMLKAINETKADVVCSQFQFIDQNNHPIYNNNFNLKQLKRIGNKEYSIISTTQIIFENMFPGCTYCLTKEVKNIYLSTCSTMIHDQAIILIGSVIGKSVYINKPLTLYRLHSNNTIGVSTNRKASLIIKKPKKPDMVELIEDIQKKKPIKKAFIYKSYSYLRLPVIIKVLKSKFCKMM